MNSLSTLTEAKSSSILIYANVNLIVLRSRTGLIEMFCISGDLQLIKFNGNSLKYPTGAAPGNPSCPGGMNSLTVC